MKNQIEEEISILETPAKENLKTDQDKGNFQNGEDFGEFIDSIYKHYKPDENLTHLVREKASIAEILRLINKNDLYLMRAAQKLSYPSLAFLIDFGSPPWMREKFTRSSEILKTFVQNLRTSEMKKTQKKKILGALLDFNEDEVEEVVIQSFNSELIKLMYAAKRSDSDYYCNDYDPDYDDDFDEDSDQKHTFRLFDKNWEKSLNLDDPDFVSQCFKQSQGVEDQQKIGGGTKKMGEAYLEFLKMEQEKGFDKN